jgi:uncharacterized protein (UPF0548 family)
VDGLIPDELTYAEVGASLGAALPPGYRHLRVRRDLGGLR